ncbi:hypothetical protein EUTSA_v10005934mg [Eutrema salsugineum]|uniref:C2H2-type domain-containing protein n=1 Tax=Eutrema salsugineum TaxID=72664 RepID=V4LMX3_EUTSA|nr:uncharacterized protein LOC18020203 [Eutrema salsugineum]ESQ43827.1 hypothetical protein EUTSA_v10005934mg [Eutrema salsugineum]
MWESDAAKAAEYATAKIAVWWDMKDCPIPEGYDAGRVRPSIEAAFKKLGYSGPVSITAYGDLIQTPNRLLRGLSSTGVAVAHTVSRCICSRMFTDMLEWRGQNPAPGSMMIISNQVAYVFSWDLIRLQQHTKYNIFVAYSVNSEYSSTLRTCKEWRWKRLLEEYYKQPDDTIIQYYKRSETGAMFHCKTCSFHSQSLEIFRKHLASKNHALEEIINPGYAQLASVTKKWGKNYAAKAEHAAAKIAVWWDMMDCPIPEGYDARQVRPSMEAAFKSLGYSGPVSITAYGDFKQTPDHLLRALSSTGVSVGHTVSEVIYKRMFSDFIEWRGNNPPPATMMVISNHVEEVLADDLAGLQQGSKYNIFLAYSYRPYKMSVLVTSAEWLLDSLLAVLEQTKHLLRKCSETGESSGIFNCTLCFCDLKSLDDFRKHLSSEEHAEEEGYIYDLIEDNLSERKLEIESKVFPKSKRLRKAFRSSS